MSRRFVDTPDTPGDGSATRKVAKLKRQNLKLKLYVSLTTTLVLLLAIALAASLWSPTAIASSTDVRPARPGFSRVTEPVEPGPEVAPAPNDRQVVLKPEQPREKEGHKGRIALLFAATLAWVAVLIRIF